MKIKVEYSESIQVAEGLWRKIGIEIEKDNVIESVKHHQADELHTSAKQYVQNWHKEGIEERAKLQNQWVSNGSPIIPTSETKIENPKESAEQKMISAINQCSEIKVLETFKLLVKNNPAFQEAYNKRMEELSK